MVDTFCQLKPGASFNALQETLAKPPSNKVDLPACLAESAEAFSKELSAPNFWTSVKVAFKELLASRYHTSVFEELTTKEMNFHGSKAGNNFCRINDVIAYLYENSNGADKPILRLHADLTLLLTLSLFVKDLTFLTMYLQATIAKFWQTFCAKAEHQIRAATLVSVITRDAFGVILSLGLSSTKDVSRLRLIISQYD